MTRSSLRLSASVGFVFLLIACAKAEGGSSASGDGDGDGGGNGMTSSGGLLTTSGSGGVTIGPSTGGAPSATGGSLMGGASSGGAASGGMLNLGGAPDGTGGAGTGGEPFAGDCAGKGDLKSVTATGDLAVYACTMKQTACTADLVGQDALWECVDSHVGNCTAQTPEGGPSWAFVSLCSEAGMGGSTN